MVLIGVACGVLIGRYVIGSDSDAPEKEKALSFVLIFIEIYVALLLSTIAHEAGHLVFGLMTGYEFRSFRIFSFMLLKEEGKLKLKRFSLAGTSGQCLMTPPEPKDGRMPFVLYNLGGVIFNVIFGGLFLTGYLLCGGTAYLSPLLLTFSVVNFVLAAANGIPMRVGTVDNDGCNVISMVKNGEALRAFWIQMMIASQNAAGVGPREMPDEWFEVPTDEAMKNSMVAVLGVFACNRLMYEEKYDEAYALISHMLEIDSGIVGLHRNLLICDEIYIELISQNRHDIVQNMLTAAQIRFMKSMKSFPSVLRTEYALALLFEKDVVKTGGILAEFEKVAKTYPYQSDIDSERVMIELARRRADGRS